jgi:hypothetical protein
MFKGKFGHLRVPGEDPENEWLGLQGWLKNTRAAMSKYIKEGCGRIIKEPQYYKLLVALWVCQFMGQTIKWTLSHFTVGT